MIEVPILIEKTNGWEEVFKIYTYVVEAEAPILLGKKFLES